MKQTKTMDEYNPYSGRQMRLLELEIDRIQAEADAYTNAPPNIVRNVWDRFVDFRKRRADLEREVSQRQSRHSSSSDMRIFITYQLGFSISVKHEDRENILSFIR